MRNRVFVLLMTLLVLGFVIAGALLKKEEYSELENRYLSHFSLAEPAEYVSDYFPLRPFFLSIRNRFAKLIGKTYINGIYLAADDYLISEYTDFDKKDALIRVINEYAQGKDVDVLLVPDSIYVNEDKLKRVLLNNEDEDISYFYEQLNTHNIDLRPVFKENKDKQLFYRSDHHWTSQGALIGYREYCKQNGITYRDKELTKVTDDFNGTSSSLALGLSVSDELYIYEPAGKLKVEYVKESKITDSLYNFEYLNKKDKYAMFLDGNHALIHIGNSNVSSGSILVIKNSYANCFIPFLCDDYRDVYVIDMRYFNDSVSDFVREHKIDKTLILYNLINLYSDSSIVKLK